MSGIYIHIPFCLKACHYCDFHFSTNLKLKSAMVDALVKEIKLKSDASSIETIYLGGGTPSVLSIDELQKVFDAIYQGYIVFEDAEITLEANPDNLNKSFLTDLFNLGINRLSIGIQTFDDKLLNTINRTHSSAQALSCIEDAKNVGIHNISADLIYAIPGGTRVQYQNDLNTLMSLDLPHISIYGMTIEEKTVFGNWAKKGKIQEVVEEEHAFYYQLTHDSLTNNGFEHYEISNFSKPTMHSKHNSNYWQQIAYIGIGPGAHSFDGKLRRFNIENNVKYIRSLENNVIPEQEEILTDTQRLNEQILTGLRTKKGLNLDMIEQRFGKNLFSDHHNTIQQLIASEKMIHHNNQLSLSFKGYMVADEICLKLFYDS
ncbi:MAG: radical SAM family heme chaperone HemW [Cyclobacteriaceae bacterium]